MSQVKNKDLRSEILDLAIDLAITSREKSSDEYKIALDNFYNKITKLLKIKDNE